MCLTIETGPWKFNMLFMRSPYIISTWVLNVHAPSEEKSDNLKDSFYEELEQVFDHFPKYDMEILLGDFNT